jgi:hypothetical protein
MLLALLISPSGTVVLGAVLREEGKQDGADADDAASADDEEDGGAVAVRVQSLSAIVAAMCTRFIEAMRRIESTAAAGSSSDDDADDGSTGTSESSIQVAKFVIGEEEDEEVVDDDGDEEEAIMMMRVLVAYNTAAASTDSSDGEGKYLLAIASDFKARREGGKSAKNGNKDCKDMIVVAQIEAVLRATYSQLYSTIPASVLIDIMHEEAKTVEEANKTSTAMTANTRGIVAATEDDSDCDADDEGTANAVLEEARDGMFEYFDELEMTMGEEMRMFRNNAVLPALQELQQKRSSGDSAASGKANDD